MDFKLTSILGEEVEYFVEETPKIGSSEEIVRVRRQAKLLEKVQGLHLSKIHPIVSKLASSERICKKLETHLSHHEDACEYVSRLLQNDGPILCSWWNSVKEQLIRLNAELNKNKEIALLVARERVHVVVKSGQTIIVIGVSYILPEQME